MRRREFITLVAATAMMPPPTVRAQETKRVRLVGVVTGFSAAEMRRPLRAFREKLRTLGWSEASNVRIEARTTDGDYGLLGDHARALIDQSVDVIVAMGTPGLTAVRQHTRTVPVVFVLVIDPVAQGLVESSRSPWRTCNRLHELRVPDWRKVARAASGVGSPGASRMVACQSRKSYRRAILAVYRSCWSCCSVRCQDRPGSERF